jgi:methylenetetrahydrofolate reductase (NADPH)
MYPKSTSLLLSLVSFGLYVTLPWLPPSTGKEIIQPDILDKESFVSWKDEAFALWTSEWGNLYEPGSSSLSILQEIASSWYLVAILDNAYAPGDVFGVLGV